MQNAEIRSIMLDVGCCAETGSEIDVGLHICKGIDLGPDVSVLYPAW